MLSYQPNDDCRKEIGNATAAAPSHKAAATAGVLEAQIETKNSGGFDSLFATIESSPGLVVSSSTVPTARSSTSDKEDSVSSQTNGLVQSLSKHSLAIEMNKAQGDTESKRLLASGCGCVDLNGSSLHEGGGGGREGNENSDGQVVVSSSPLSDNCARCARSKRPSWIIPFFVFLIGTAASTAFIVMGVVSEHKDVHAEFAKHAAIFPAYFRDLLFSYDVVGLWAHQAVMYGDLSRERFADIYQHVRSTGLLIESIDYIPKVMHSERAYYENETRSFLQSHFPDYNYQGFVGLNATTGKHSIVPLDQQEFYFVQHYVEPVRTSEDLNKRIDFDTFSSPARRMAIETALETKAPALSQRFGHNESDYSVTMIHPGIGDNNFTSHDMMMMDGATEKPRPSVSLAKIQFTLYNAIRRAAKSQKVFSDGHVSLYLFDTTFSEDAIFLGGVDVQECCRGGCNGNDGHSHGDYNVHEDAPQDSTQIELHNCSLTETNLSAISSGRMGFPVYQWKYEETLSIMSRNWTVVVTQERSRLSKELIYIVLGGAIIILASASLALWLYTDTIKAVKIDRLKCEGEHERAALMVASANHAARAERELNDYVAHEVRNPLAAAISAHSFVHAQVHSENAFSTPEGQTTVKEDLEIIGNSLHFINDLLRSMLDISRASTNRMTIETKLTDVKKDVLEPVRSMLYLRDCKVDVLVECCPPDLVIMADCLRLKQVVFNLVRNASKFVRIGFIRIKAHVRNDDNTVQISIEDSGPGVPPEKRLRLFSKFQSSLDRLNQGTGIGLSLSKTLTDLMGMGLWLDEEFDSGIDECPGARFVINTNVQPQHDTDDDDDDDDDVTINGTRLDGHCGGPITSRRNDDNDDKGLGDCLLLPKNLSVLFVDDDTILRKLFVRAVRKAAPDWRIHEASNGETALQLVEENLIASNIGNKTSTTPPTTTPFDMIFMDQYMASIEQQLLGTETTRELRSRGCGSVICGLSANDMQLAFQEAGADSFIFKPFPAEPAALQKELFRVLQSAEDRVHLLQQARQKEEEQQQQQQKEALNLEMAPTRSP